jgi:DNA-binding beta-propeller fold protein YncE
MSSCCPEAVAWAPNSLNFGHDKNLYVSDGFFGTNSVLRYNGTTGAYIGVFATGGGLNVPQDLIFGPDGNLFVHSVLTNRVLRYDGTTGAPLPAAGQAEATFVPNDGGSLAFGSDGNLYIANSATSSVRRYDGTTGAFIDVFVTTGSGGLNYYRLEAGRFGDS